MFCFVLFFHSFGKVIPQTVDVWRPHAHYDYSDYSSAGLVVLLSLGSPVTQGAGIGDCG